MFLTVAPTLGVAGLLIFAAFGSVCAVPIDRPPNVAVEVWRATEGGGTAEVLVVLDEQTDLSAAADLPTREERLRYVYGALRSTALRSQAALRARLERAGVSYRPFYIVNMIALEGDRELLADLAARPEVGRVVASPQVRQALPDPRPDGVRPMEVQGVEWNVARINADEVWGLGYAGEGIVVAGQDTGYDWDHPALIEQYRGYNGITATHDYNWHDAIHSGGGVCGADSSEPCGDYGHGTHTMGTIVGDDGEGNQIGVATGARWIGCRNMDEGVGSPATYAECFEFFLAPYPIDGDPFTDGEPGMAPHVINNSWTCPPYEGCDSDTLQEIVENVRAAGIAVVASAGNSGPQCSTVQDPPAIYDAALSVGATNSDNIASFSSRGPVAVDGFQGLKPDVSAPGVDVRSSMPGGIYGSMSGTSMAGPHVAGAMALLWSAAPSLLGDVDVTEQVIARAARPRTSSQGCGGDGPTDVPNNVYGWGIVDALAAVQGVLSRVQVAKRADFPPGLQVRSLDYTLTVTSTSPFTLTNVVLTDTIPLSTTLAWAEGDYEQMGGIVKWTKETLAPQETLTATLGVTVEHLPRGSHVVNDSYGVRANELPVPVMGAPVEVPIPWRLLLFPVFKRWSPGE